jgi:hypothetical protein
VNRLASGARRGELLALRWQNVDLERAIIKIDTLNKQRPVGSSLRSRSTVAVQSLPPVPWQCFTGIEGTTKFGWLGMSKPDADLGVLQS